MDQLPRRTATPEGSAAGHTRVVAREFFAAALYMALVLLAALVAFPVDRLPTDGTVVSTLVGTAVGLVLAHWLAFRLAAHLTDVDGVWSAATGKEAAAQVAGGVSVALVASVPFLLADGADAVRVALWLLAALPALTGLAIARLRNRSWVRSGAAAAAVFLVALVVVEVKAAVGH